MIYVNDLEIMNYWIEELVEEFPDLPLDILKIEYTDALGTARNEKLWALGSNESEESQLHYINAELNVQYADWLNDRAVELYGEVLR